MFNMKLNLVFCTLEPKEFALNQKSTFLRVRIKSRNILNSFPLCTITVFHSVVQIKSHSPPHPFNHWDYKQHSFGIDTNTCKTIMKSAYADVQIIIYISINYYIYVCLCGGILLRVKSIVRNFSFFGRKVAHSFI